MPTIYLYKNPPGSKKFRAEIPVVGHGHQTRVVEFGAKGYSDYTLHKDPLRMERYVDRHGGEGTRFTDPKKVHAAMLKRTKSTKEDWSRNGLYTAGYWSRWLLWSQPTLRGAIKYMEQSVLPKGYKIILKNSK